MARRIYSVGIYARLSVESGDRKNESIQTQIEIAKEYMKGRDDMVLYDCYSDLGRTGTNFEREGFELLMADVRLRRVDCVIVKDFSRFGRNYIETGNYIQKIFPFLGVRFVSVTDCFDSLFAENDDIGVNLKNLANEMYARDIALKVKSSKRAKRESGSYVGGISPYGYRAEWVGGKKCLFAETGSAEVVRWIFSQYDQGRSLREIAGSLYAQEIHRPTEYRRYHHLRRQQGEALHEWPRTSIKAILTNAVYTGCLVLGDINGGNDVLRQLKGGVGTGNGESGSGGTGSGGSENCRIRSGESGSSGIECNGSGSSRKGSSESKYEPVRENTHEAIVSREQFYRIARRFEKRAEKIKEQDFGVDKASDEGRTSVKRRTSDEGKAFRENRVFHRLPETKDIFDGVLFCGCCGKKLGRRGLAGQSDSGREIENCKYFCRNANRIDDFCCATGTISKDVLTEMVNAILRQEAALNDIRQDELVRENMKCAGWRKAQIQKEINALQKKLKASEWAGSEQYRKYREGIISREAFLEWKARNEKEAEKAKTSLEEIRRRIDEVDERARRQNILLGELAVFSEKSEPDGELISALIERIALYPDKRVEITFRFT